MSTAAVASDRQLESELIGAALRYVALADWFEARPMAHHRRDGEREAMDAFNVVEAELRRAGARLLRRLGHRELVLEQVLSETLPR
ncbi:MAG: hypothetical protein IPM13_10460 [Phycisphaerales bacterium]|nr:hypothetical protein [Phycisphaerales bacterium]